MSSDTHPSAQELSAFYDRELSPAETTSVEEHLTACSGCRTEIEAFSVMAELGPRVEESLPGESYWKDLPDRILARLAAESMPEPVPAATPGFWQRLLHPEGGLRFALGVTAAVAVVGAAWIILQGQPNPWRPGTGDLVAENQAAPGDPSQNLTDPEPAPENAETYTQRVVSTFGDRNNLGESLDIVPGQSATTSGPAAGIGSRVSYSLPPLGAQARESAQGVVSVGCGEQHPLEQAYLAALRAEEAGEYALASQGYQLVQNSLPRGNALHHEAEYRLQLLAWKQRMETAWNERAKAIQELNQQAAGAFQAWQETQRQQDCQKAWCMNKVLLNLGPEVADGQDIQMTAARIKQLKSCVE